MTSKFYLIRIAVALIVFAILVLILVFAVPWTSFGKEISYVSKFDKFYVRDYSDVQRDELESGEVVCVSGLLRLVGNASLGELVLTTSRNYDIYLNCPQKLQSELQNNVYRQVRINGRVERYALSLANGDPVPDRIVLFVDKALIFTGEPDLVLQIFD
jgi:hypothetical protein